LPAEKLHHDVLSLAYCDWGHLRVVAGVKMALNALGGARLRPINAGWFPRSPFQAGVQNRCIRPPQIQEYARVRARESSKVSWEPTGTLTPIDVDARPNRNSRDCSYAVTQFGIVS
jgi:hypothetical protein